MARFPVVAIIGDGDVPPDSPIGRLAEALGRMVMDRGYVLITGGRGGVMFAASRGARAASTYQPGRIIGVLPGSDPRLANQYVDLPLCTGLNHARNVLVAQADAVIAVGGGAGTLSEMAMAWIHDRLIVAMRVDGWSGRLADTRIDSRHRPVSVADDRVFGADTVEDAAALLDRYLPAYRRG